MMFKSIALVQFLMWVVCMIDVTAAKVKCIECTNDKNDGYSTCNDPYMGSVYLPTCTGDYCFKGTVSNKDTIERGCINNDDTVGQDTKVGECGTYLMDHKGFNVNFNICKCDVDMCNTASSLVTTTKVIVFALAGFIVRRFCM